MDDTCVPFTMYYISGLIVVVLSLYIFYIHITTHNTTIVSPKEDSDLKGGHSEGQAHNQREFRGRGRVPLVSS